MVTDDNGIFQIIVSENSLSLLEIQEWLIDANLAFMYLLTNFYINKTNASPVHIFNHYSNFEYKGMKQFELQITHKLQYVSTPKVV